MIFEKKKEPTKKYKWKDLKRLSYTCEMEGKESTECKKIKEEIGIDVEE